MKKNFAFLAVMACFAGCVSTPEKNPEASLANRWFGGDVDLNPINEAVQEVSVKGQVAGWIFRTDKVEPVVVGKRGEIGVLAGLNRKGEIVGLKPMEWREDAKYFGRLQDGFFKQFIGRPVSKGREGLDTVTGATRSSRAIVRDVTEGAAQVLAMPAVAAQLEKR